MAHKSIKVSKFYSKKNPDIRIVFPSEHHNISEDSNCDSDDSEAGFAKKRYQSDFIIPESSPESTSEEEPAPKQSLPKRGKKRIISTVCVADRYADFNASKPNKPQSSRKLEFASPKNNLQNVSSPLQKLGNKGRAKTVDRRKNPPENAALVDECHGNLGNSPSSSDTLHNPEHSDGSPKVSKDPRNSNEKEMSENFFSQEDSFSLKLQLSQDDPLCEKENDLSSPCTSPTPSLLASPIQSDSDLDLRDILFKLKSSNEISRNASPDLFEESDSDVFQATYVSTEVMPLHSVENLRHSALQTSEKKKRGKTAAMKKTIPEKNEVSTAECNGGYENLLLSSDVLRSPKNMGGAKPQSYSSSLNIKKRSTSSTKENQSGRSVPERNETRSPHKRLRKYGLQHEEERPACESSGSGKKCEINGIQNADPNNNYDLNGGAKTPSNSSLSNMKKRLSSNRTENQSESRVAARNGTTSPCKRPRRSGLRHEETSPARETSDSLRKCANKSVQNPKLNSHNRDSNAMPETTDNDTNLDRDSFSEWLEGDLSDSGEQPVDNECTGAGQVSLGSNGLGKPESNKKQIQSQGTHVLSPQVMHEKNTIPVSKEKSPSIRVLNSRRTTPRATKSTNCSELASGSGDRSCTKVPAKRLSCTPFAKAKVSTPKVLKASNAGKTLKKRGTQTVEVEVESEQDGEEDEVERWREGDLEETVRHPVEIPPPDTVKRPIEYFLYYFDENILNHIVEQSNLYCMQKTGKSLDLSIAELKTFLGMWIYMGITSLPNLRDYWNTELRVSQVADCMPVKRFQRIRAHLHLSDNLDDSEEAVHDRYRKVRPLLSHIQNKCRALPQGSKLAIDEMVVKYKGKFSSLKQYNPNKPIKYGFKFYGLADKIGLIYDILPSCGSSTFDRSNLSEEEAAMGVGAKAVIALSKQIQNPQASMLFFDNWFSSIGLMSYLRTSMNILAVGTIRKDRTQHCPFMEDKMLQRSGRGAVESYVSSDAVVVVRWMDSKPVCLASTAAGVEPKTTVKRFEKAARGRVEIPCPRIIQLYNEHMGGVDLSDQLVAAHRVPTRSKRWYFPIIGYLLDLAVTNSYILYCRDNKLLAIPPKDVNFKCAKDFRLAISSSLRCVERHREERPLVQNFARKSQLVKSPTYRPPEEVRFDGTNHWLIFSDSTARCKNCIVGKTTVKCSKCDLNLCCKSTRNCFVDFHKKKRN